jgi:hypothetical protein
VVEHAGDGLLLEPLAGVARRDPGPRGQLGRARGAALGKRPVEPELGAEVDGEQLERAERRGEQPLGQGVGAIGVGHTERVAHPRAERYGGFLLTRPPILAGEQSDHSRA